MATSSRHVTAVLAAFGLLAACSPSATLAQPKTPITKPATQPWVDQPVTFQAGGLTIDATYRHPATTGGRLPAVLLIAGSGPTDRNGNSAVLAGPVDTLKTLADWLSADGVISLRYDKLGSGQTALKYLARQPAVDPDKLGVIGHSEGALFALLLATGTDPPNSGPGPLPAVHALGLLEPLAERYLDVLTVQVEAQIAAAERAKLLTVQQAARLNQAWKAGMARLRATGTVPPNVPAGLSSILSPANALFLSQADRYDPARLAARLPAGLPVLVSCSNVDQNVTCGEVRHLLAGLAAAPADTDFTMLTGVDHVLKQDPSGSSAGYAQPLPFSPQLLQALRRFTTQHL
jgi:pimeloyl-ACP methyl ester carboxylesterase